MVNINNQERLYWSDMFLLGCEEMDEMHRDFVKVVSRLQQADNNELEEALLEVMEHLESHFHSENLLMRETGYPGMVCHVSEHAAVLATGYSITKAIRKGNAALCRTFASELAGWFPGHADHLDAPLAQWLSRKRFGAIPVVLKRGATGSQTETSKLIHSIVEKNNE